MESPDHRDWEQALDGLEQYLARTETMVRTLRPDEIGLWSPPQVSTPLPRHLAGRARSLLERLEALQATVPGVMERVRRERAVADRISRATGRSRSAVYVDASA
jgi:hypothetical protein